MRRMIVVAALVVGAAAVSAHVPEASPNKGVGPIKEVKLGPLDKALAEKGEHVFEQKCMGCHKFEERYVGPALRGVTTRRSPEWIMNMILNPSGMLEKDETARDLLGQYMTPMTFQNVTEADARAILEYARSVDAKHGAKGEAKGDAKRGAKRK